MKRARSVLLCFLLLLVLVSCSRDTKQLETPNNETTPSQTTLLQTTAPQTTIAESTPPQTTFLQTTAPPDSKAVSLPVAESDVHLIFYQNRENNRRIKKVIETETHFFILHSSAENEEYGFKNYALDCIHKESGLLLAPIPSPYGGFREENISAAYTAKPNTVFFYTSGGETENENPLLPSAVKYTAHTDSLSVENADPYLPVSCDDFSYGFAVEEANIYIETACMTYDGLEILFNMEEENIVGNFTNIPVPLTKFQFHPGENCLELVFKNTGLKDIKNLQGNVFIRSVDMQKQGSDVHVKIFLTEYAKLFLVASDGDVFHPGREGHFISSITKLTISFNHYKLDYPENTEAIETVY